MLYGYTIFSFYYPDILFWFVVFIQCYNLNGNHKSALKTSSLNCSSVFNIDVVSLSYLWQHYVDNISWAILYLSEPHFNLWINGACWDELWIKIICFSLVCERVSVHKQPGWQPSPFSVHSNPLPQNLKKRDLGLSYCEVFSKWKALLKCAPYVDVRKISLVCEGNVHIIVTNLGYHHMKIMFCEYPVPLIIIRYSLNLLAQAEQCDFLKAAL